MRPGWRLFTLLRLDEKLARRSAFAKEMRVTRPESGSMARVILALALLLVACSSSGRPPAANNSSPNVQAPTQQQEGGTITVAVINNVTAMARIGTSATTGGGFLASAELHSEGLVTSDEHSRQPVGRLASRVPSLDNGDVSILPDGRMRVVYPLRQGITWQDGEPFTAEDMVFSYAFNSDPGLPFISEVPFNLIQSVEAPDDHTVVIYFAQPYYAPDKLGLLRFWPEPKHILEPAYERYLATKNADDILNLPYWTSEYVNTGPFRVTEFDPADRITLQAYDGYFLGRPKLDKVYLQVFADPNTLYANLLAGTVDIFLETTIPVSLGFELADRWAQSGGGTVYIRRSAERFLSPQMRPDVQVEPATFDTRVRAALYRAFDREALATGLEGGHTELASYEILPPDDPLYGATKDSLRPYAYDPARAKAELQDLGWILGPDGLVHNAVDGRTLRAPLWGIAGDVGTEVPAVADYWRRIGVDVEEFIVPPAQVRDPQYRASYPGWELSSQAGGDGILGRLEGPVASAATRWQGNRGGYEDARATQLISAYRSSVTPDAQFQTMKALSDFVADQLPFLVLYYTAESLGASNRVVALDDEDGGDSAGRAYGSYSRNGHLWQLR